jgi:hypothetical protein
MKIVSFMPWQIHTRDCAPSFHSTCRWVGPTGDLDVFEKVKICGPFQKSNPDYTARSLDTTLTELSLFLRLILSSSLRTVVTECKSSEASSCLSRLVSRIKMNSPTQPTIQNGYMFRLVSTTPSSGLSVCKNTEHWIRSLCVENF